MYTGKIFSQILYLSCLVYKNKLTEFINEFPVKDQIAELGCYSTNIQTKLEENIGFPRKVAAHVATELSRELGTPIASYGNDIFCEPDVNLSESVTTTVKINGKPTDIVVTFSNLGTITKDDTRFNEAVQRFLNRKADLLLKKYEYEQDHRNFFKKKVRKSGSIYGFRQGIQVNAHVSADGWQSIIIDPVTEVRNQLNLKEALEKELEKRNISHWKNIAADQEEEINKLFRTRAANIRSTYVEQKGDDVTHNRYQFDGFDFKNELKENGEITNPVNFHKKFKRKFSMDQPIVKLIAKGGYHITHIPELVEEVPSLHVMKRYGASGEIQTRALMEAKDRFYNTKFLLKPLVQEGFINDTPMIVSVDEYGPVKLTLEGSFIDIKTNLDFQKIYLKHKLLVKPKIHSINVFSTKKDAEETKRLLKALQGVMKNFGVDDIKVNEHIACSEKLDEFTNEIVGISKKEKFTPEDLVLVVFKPNREDTSDHLYTTIKSESLENLFPVQFVESPQLAKLGAGDIIPKLANPLFLQIVAKCQGQPYGLQEGFVLPGTVFVGIDRYRDPFATDAKLVSSIVVFDEFGKYVCSATEISDDKDNPIKIDEMIRECLTKYEENTKRKPKLVLFILDTGPGTQEDKLMQEANTIENICNDIGADYAYITANKGSHLRVYTGDPSSKFRAKRVSPFSAITHMRDSREILIVTTEPMVSQDKGREIGTPKPMLYRILKKKYSNSDDELKKIIAKSIVWLCKHAWISPAATRLPAPLEFANKLGRLSNATGKTLQPDKSTAPLFL